MTAPLPPAESSAVGPERARSPWLIGSPHGALRPFLARDYAGFAERPAPHQLVLPASAAVPFVLRVNDPLDRPPAFVLGVHDSYMTMPEACAPEYVEVWLAPLGAYSLLGVPMTMIRGYTIDLDMMFGSAALRLADRVREAPTWESRFALVDEFLLERLDRGPQPAPEVRWAWHRLTTTAGAAPIGRIAKDVGWSHKHLIAKFKQQIGVSPKTAARLIRFESVWRRLDQAGPLRWGDVAADSGFADQAHLDREFRRFTGTTPTDFVAAAARHFDQVNSVQDTIAGVP
jgi:AraC-like DNA-binding protein